ncbi:UNVERIFIED_CONTAM: Transmembrane 9 superfamily member 12 [Sesamum radiatum]|uniref:Transmembrane 9 superfamily member n=1 Tax=Sesamum radiatum TaxID=300843 RepID=A0AAW2NRW8_SESRA
MALPLISRRKLCTAFVCLVLVFQTTYGFYLPGSYMHTYSTGDEIYAKVNSLTSIETELPFSYYSLPYCKPQGGIKKSAENLGELLMGDQICNSPYRFRMNVNESLYICTTPPLSEYEVKLLKQRTRDLYQVNMILDNLPAMSVKYDPEKMAKLHRYDNVTSVSCPLELDKSQIIREQERVSFTYEVEFVKSNIRWPSRWDAYLKMEGARVHWFSILNSLMVISFLAGIVFVIFLRTVRRDLTRYEELDKEAQAQMNEELSGWKLVVGDVFREPSHSKLLCVMVGDGVQITGMAVVTIVFAALGFMSPASRGMLLTGMILLYLFLGIAAGYVGVLPLTLLGGHFGTRAQPIQYPVRTNQIPREIPARKYPSWLLVLGAGTLPFGTLFIELFFILSSIWLGRFYYVFGFLLIVLLLVIVCAEVSVVLTYMHLCVEDWMWWWKAFYASGSVALYVFLYSVNYLVFDLKSLSGPVSATLYLGYSLIMAIAIMLSTGTIGFLTSFYFVHYLFSSVKID